jgi:hypothetical protein
MSKRDLISSIFVVLFLVFIVVSFNPIGCQDDRESLKHVPVPQPTQESAGDKPPKLEEKPLPPVAPSPDN